MKSAARPYGDWRRAEWAGPASPDRPGVPSPATDVNVPFDDSSQMRWPAESARYSAPEGEVAMPSTDPSAGAAAA